MLFNIVDINWNMAQSWVSFEVLRIRTCVPNQKWMSAALPRGDGQCSGLLAFARHQGLGAVFEVGSGEILLVNGLAQAVRQRFSSVQVSLVGESSPRSQPGLEVMAVPSWESEGCSGKSHSGAVCLLLGVLPAKPGTQAKNLPTVHMPGVALRPVSCSCGYQDISSLGRAWNAPHANTMVLKKSLLYKRVE